MEIIITIALLGIVTALIFSFIDFGVNVFGVGSDYTNEQANLRLAAYKVTDEVRNTRYISLDNVSSLTGSPTYSIERTADGIIKTNHSTSETQKLSDASLSNITFEINQVPEGKRFEYELVVRLNQDERTSISTGVFLNNVMYISGANTTGSVLYFTDPATTIGDSDYYVAEEEEEEEKLSIIYDLPTGVKKQMGPTSSNEGNTIFFSLSTGNNCTINSAAYNGVALTDQNGSGHTFEGTFDMPVGSVTITANVTIPLFVSGAPTSDFSIGDYATDGSGNVYRCIRAVNNGNKALTDTSYWTPL